MKIDKKSIDINKIPFSRFGSYFVISVLNNKLWIRDIRGGDNTEGKIFEMSFSENVTVLMTETQLNVLGKQGALHITFINEDTLSFKGNLKVKFKYQLKRYDTICNLTDDIYELTSYSQEVKIGIKREKGTLKVLDPWDKVGNTKIELCCEHYYHFFMCSYKTVFTESIIKHRSHGYTFEYWNTLIPNDQTAASYITWMNFVKPEGQLKRYAMYMSKNWMTNIWSWDNCFSAIFLAHIDSDISLDQYLMFSDHQDRSGMYPDFMNDKYVSFSCAKPPIYGWAYEQMCQINPVFKNITLQEKVYDTISRFTNFWLKHRMSEEGLPYYIHGNESGWDNGTFYKRGVPMITPDLASFLIRQLDFLAKLALDLGLNYESNRLTAEADRLFDRLMSMLWTDDGFVGYSLKEKKYIDGSNTLQSLLPLIIHYRLSEDVKEKLLSILKDESKFLTKYGLATESIKSSDYQANGYWRGPIWAPVMLLFTSCLEDMGEKEFHKSLVTRFFNCMKEFGMAENFDAKKGKGLVDPAFAWTSSVYLHYLFKYDFLKDKKR